MTPSSLLNHKSHKSPTIIVASRRQLVSVPIARRSGRSIATWVRVIGVLVWVGIFSAGIFEVMGFDVRHVPKYTTSTSNSNIKKEGKKGPGTAIWGTYTAVLQWKSRNGTQANPPMLVSSSTSVRSHKETSNRKPNGFKGPPLRMMKMSTKNNNAPAEERAYWNGFIGNGDTTNDETGGDDYLDLLPVDEDDECDKDLSLPLPYLILKMARRFPPLPYYMRKDFSTTTTTTTTTLTRQNKIRNRQQQQQQHEQHQQFFDSTHQEAWRYLQLDANVRAVFDEQHMDVLKTNRLSTKAPSRPIRVEGVEMVAYELGFPVRSKYASGVAMAMATPTKGIVQLTLYWQYHSFYQSKSGTGSKAKGIAMPASQMQRLHVDLSPKRQD